MQGSVELESSTFKPRSSFSNTAKCYLQPFRAHESVLTCSQELDSDTKLGILWLLVCAQSLSLPGLYVEGLGRIVASL